VKKDSQHVYAFVEMVNNEDAKKLLDDSINITIKGSSIYVAKFKPAEKRAQERSQKLNQTSKFITVEKKIKCLSNPSQIESPLDILQDAILEECADEDKESAKFLKASKKLSPDQIQVLNNDSAKFHEWFRKVDGQN